jgi:hypothetical protein
MMVAGPPESRDIVERRLHGDIPLNSVSQRAEANNKCHDITSEQVNKAVLLHCTHMTRNRSVYSC